jgi:hypothetical protein
MSASHLDLSHELHRLHAIAWARVRASDFTPDVKATILSALAFTEGVAMASGELDANTEEHSGVAQVVRMLNELAHERSEQIAMVRYKDVVEK